MVQGHVCDTLLSPDLRGNPLYRFQEMFHGSTAPAFSSLRIRGGPPAFSLSLKASCGAPVACSSCWRRICSSPAVLLVLENDAGDAVEHAALFACDALQAIA